MGPDLGWRLPCDRTRSAVGEQLIGAQSQVSTAPRLFKIRSGTELLKTASVRESIKKKKTTPQQLQDECQAGRIPIEQSEIL